MCKYYKTQEAEAAANSILQAAYSLRNSNQTVVDDMTVVIVFLDKKLIERSMKEEGVKKSNKLLQDILSSENVIEEVVEE